MKELLHSRSTQQMIPLPDLVSTIVWALSWGVAAALPAAPPPTTARGGVERRPPVGGAQVSRGMVRRQSAPGRGAEDSDTRTRHRTDPALRHTLHQVGPRPCAAPLPANEDAAGSHM